MTEADCFIATTCVSYLLHTVRAGPLSGSSAATPLADPTSKKYPLLRYSAEFWATHFADYTQNLSIFGNRLLSSDGLCEVLSSLINAFIADKKKITTWIEAAWLFGSPNIPDPRLSPKAAFKCSRSNKFSNTPLAVAINNFNELSKDLAVLHRDWHHILTVEPNEIWEPSIPSFTKSRFWVDTTESCLSSYAHSQNSKEYITIKSQISDSGLEIGVIRLAIPW